jgi:hypothetical protein
VANFKILPDYTYQGSAAGGRTGHRICNATGHFRMYGFAHHIKDVFFRGEIFVQGTDGRTGCPGNLPSGGFMETLLDEKLNGGIGDLAASSFHQIRILDLGGDVSCSNQLLHGNLYTGVMKVCAYILFFQIRFWDGVIRRRLATTCYLYLNQGLFLSLPKTSSENLL